MWLLVIVSLIVVYVTISVLRYLRWKAYFDKMPGSTDFKWASGNQHIFETFNEEGIQVHSDLMEKFPYFFRLWYGPAKPYIICVHPDIVKTVIKNSPPKPFSKGLFTTAYQMGLPWIGEGLLFAAGDKWKRNRRLLTPSFHFDALKSYMGIFNETGDVCVDAIRDKTKGGKSVNVQELMSLQSLDVLLQCAFSFESNCQVTGSKYVESIKALTHQWQSRFLTLHYWIDFIYQFTDHCKKFTELCDYVHGVAEDVINKRKKELEGKTLENTKVKDFLDTLLLARDEEGKGLTDLEIRNEVDTFMFEGHDTTAMGLAYFLYNMALNPEHQEKCYKEIMEVMGDRDEVEWADHNKLEYMTMCIKENLRLNNSIPIIGRTLDKDLDFNGTIIPKDTELQIWIHLMHTHPLIWDKPKEFRPERFHPDKVKDMHPFQFMPFSAGSRNCIGQNFAMYEMKTLLPKILKKYKITFDESVKVRRVFAIAITSENGINLFFTPRDEK